MANRQNSVVINILSTPVTQMNFIVVDRTPGLMLIRFLFERWCGDNPHVNDGTLIGVRY
jgi:hypothetical protein